MVESSPSHIRPKRPLLRRLLSEQLRARLGPLLELRGRSRYLTGRRNRCQQRLDTVGQLLDDCAHQLPKAPFSPEMTIDQVWNHHPGAPAVFRRYHLNGCNSCAVRFDETLQEAATAYGLDLSSMIEELDALLEGQ